MTGCDHSFGAADNLALFLLPLVWAELGRGRQTLSWQSSSSLVACVAVVVDCQVYSRR